MSFESVVPTSFRKYCTNKCATLPVNPASPETQWQNLEGRNNLSYERVRLDMEYTTSKTSVSI
jgi:hypothetical protein